MMEDSILHKAASMSTFKVAASIGIQNLLAAARILSSIGLDINTEIAKILESLNLQLMSAAYEVTNLDDLLRQARAIGDEIVKTQQGAPIPPKV
jgi:hypothetical protein